MKRFLPVLLFVVLAACPRWLPAADVTGRPDLITAETESCIKKGQAFLARTQGRNGSWFGQHEYGGSYPCCMTALAGLALMGGGSTPSEGPYAENVRRGLYFLLGCSNRSGLISVLEAEERPMYGHGFGMLFLAQAYGAEHDLELQKRIHDVLWRAVTLTGKSQSDHGGWNYGPDDHSDEGSVTVTQIQGLRACRNAGIKVPKRTIDRACDYIAKCSEADGGICYSIDSRGSRPAITAAACAVMYNAGQYENPVAKKALEYTRKTLSGGDVSAYGGHDAYGLLYAAEAMFLSSPADWKRLFPKWREQLIHQQNSDGSWGGGTGASVYETSMRLLVLELPYQYLPILQR